VLPLLKQPRSKILFDLGLQKYFVAAFQNVYRGKCLICLNVAAAQVGHCHGRRKGGRGGLSPWILKFSTKKVVFLVVRGKNQNSPLLVPLGKNLEKFPSASAHALEKILPTLLVNVQFISELLIKLSTVF